LHEPEQVLGDRDLRHTRVAGGFAVGGQLLDRRVGGARAVRPQVKVVVEHHTRLRAGTLSHGGMSLRRVFLVIALALGVVPLAPPPAFAMPAPAARFLAARITGAGRSIVTGAIRTTVGFDVAGLRYDGPPDAQVELRASRDGRSFTPWYEAE